MKDVFKNKKKIKLTDFDKNLLNNINIKESVFKNNIYNINTNFKQLFNFIFSYIEELLNVIENKNTIEKINSIINKDEIILLIKKLENYHNEKYNIYEEIINDFKIIYDIYILIITLHKRIDEIIILIKEINILEERILLSNTSKNIINENKYAILELYKNINYNNNNLISIFIDHSLNFITYNNSNYIVYIIFNYIYHFNIVIDLYIHNIKFILKWGIGDNSNSKNSKYIQTKIEIINDILENKNILDELKNTIYNSNYNTNLNIFIELFLNEYDDSIINIINSITKKKIFLNNYRIINKKNIHNLYSYYNFSKLIQSKFYSNLNQLFDKELNLKNTNKFNEKNNISDNIKYIQEYINQYNKLFNKNLIIIIFQTSLDNINYNSDNLLNKNIIINSNQGINLNYINKSQTILNQQLNQPLNKPSRFENIRDANDFKQPSYISNVNNIIYINEKCINNYNSKNNNSFIEYLMNIDILLINQCEISKDLNTFSILKNKNTLQYLFKLYDFQNLIFNEPNYNIENYNNILESGIINNTLDNALEIYLKKVNTDIKSYDNFNHIELKNNIIDEIKLIKLKLNNENKNKIIDKILNIFSNKVSNFIQKNNKITFTSELQLTYISNINNLLSKLKKELIDNYNEELIINIDKILNTFYNNIITIYNNIIDKIYYSDIKELFD